ncbi:CUE domain-containing 5 [Lecanosticta acicola]|uniref:CUE domain-containing 5 n=1 Tax=Lecanosticta acicola TaxID=111012 RepID=A0AAI9E8S8_9PEZI|nr:CUE domain-containing 5 [Lecanosticta acicola]
MADHQPVSPIKPEESATTREEMDFDDNEQETGTVSPQGHETSTRPPAKSSSPRPRVSFQEGHEEIPPAKPPRPLSPAQQAENTLIEAFPSIDTKVVKAVLMASNGKVEPAFNALLGMSDPDFKPEEALPAPPQPPRPAMRQQQPMSQLEADEMYARQLAEQYNSGGQRSQNRYNQREPGRRGPNQQTYVDDEDKERSFFDDDLPEIGKNIQQGFLETQKRVNSWITNFKKKIDGEDEEDDLYSSSEAGSRQNTGGLGGRKNFGPSQSEQMHGIRRSAEQARRSTEAQRYDADPHELGPEEFERLELRDDEAPPPQPPRTSSRKSANPDLFKSDVKPPQSGPVDEVDAADRRSSSKDASEAEKNKKWQPLTSVAPHPEDDNDPFSLGDDDEDKEKGDDLRKEDTERLKESAKNSASAGTAGDLKPQESENSGGVRDKAAEEILSGKKS